MSMEACWASESEFHPPARFVVLDGVADRTVPSGGTYRESSVQAHGRPLTVRPEAVIRAGKGIDQRADHCCRCGNSSLMHVDDHAGKGTGAEQLQALFRKRPAPWNLVQRAASSRGQTLLALCVSRYIVEYRCTSLAIPEGDQNA